MTDAKHQSTDEVTTTQLLAGRQRAALLVYHREGVKVVALEPGRPIVVGRSEPADLMLNDRKLSRQHARFTFSEGQIWLEDLGSTNGTFVNGQQMDGCLLQANDEVVVGMVSISVDLVHGPDQVQLVGHETFTKILSREVVRAKTFSRPLAVAMIRAADRDAAPLINRWYPRVRSSIRAVDHSGLFGMGVVELALPEFDEAQTQTLLSTIVGSRRPGEPALLAGFAVYPTLATSAQALIEVSQRAAQQATADQPVRGGGPSFSREIETAKPVVHSPKMQVLYGQVQRLAHASVPVLIVGETGTGKELIARALHENGPRRRAQIHAVNCGSIPEHLLESTLFGHEQGAFTDASRQAIGLFEAAEGGTVLLDEIGELPPSAQVALLRVLETKRITRVGGTAEIAVDVRVVAATHRDLEAMCDTGAFRFDLLYRLNTVVLEVPPLRLRQEEIGPLCELFIDEANRANGTAVAGLSSEALRCLRRYQWPGNVRELRNAIERAVLVAQRDRLAADDFPAGIRELAAVEEFEPVQTMVTPERPKDKVKDTPVESPDAGTAASHEHPPMATRDFRDLVKRFEIGLIMAALRQKHFRQTDAAELLRIPLRTLVYKIRAYNLTSPEGYRMDPGVLQEATESLAKTRESFRERIASFERQHISATLRRYNWNKAAAARALRMPIRTLTNKLSRLELRPPDGIS